MLTGGHVAFSLQVAFPLSVVIVGAFVSELADVAGGRLEKGISNNFWSKIRRALLNQQGGSEAKLGCSRVHGTVKECRFNDKIN